MTITELLTKVTTPLSTLPINIQVSQKALLESGSSTPTAAAKRGLAILETTELRSLLHDLYPAITLTSTELNDATEIVTIKTRLKPYSDYIKFSIPLLKAYIPEETVAVLEDYFREEDPIYFIAVTTFVVVLGALKQSGDL